MTTAKEKMKSMIGNQTTKQLMDLARYFNDKTETHEIIISLAIDDELSNRLDDVTFTVFMEELEASL